MLAGAVGAAEQNHLCTLAPVPPRESQSLAAELLPLPNHKGARGDEPGTRAATLFLAPKKPGLLRHWHRHHRYLCHHPNSSGGGFAKQTERIAPRPTRHLQEASAKLPTAPAARQGCSQPRAVPQRRLSWQGPRCRPRSPEPAEPRMPEEPLQGQEEPIHVHR